MNELVFDIDREEAKTVNYLTNRVSTKNHLPNRIHQVYKNFELKP